MTKRSKPTIKRMNVSVEPQQGFETATSGPTKTIEVQAVIKYAIEVPDDWDNEKIADLEHGRTATRLFEYASNIEANLEFTEIVGDDGLLVSAPAAGNA